MVVLCLTPVSFISDVQYLIPAEPAPVRESKARVGRGIVGIQKPGMASFDYIHVLWIPAVHAGIRI
jgi:hypothetical protein